MYNNNLRKTASDYKLPIETLHHQRFMPALRAIKDTWNRTPLPAKIGIGAATLGHAAMDAAIFYSGYKGRDVMDRLRRKDKDKEKTASIELNEYIDKTASPLSTSDVFAHIGGAELGHTVGNLVTRGALDRFELPISDMERQLAIYGGSVLGRAYLNPLPAPGSHSIMHSLSGLLSKDRANKARSFLADNPRTAHFLDYLGIGGVTGAGISLYNKL